MVTTARRGALDLLHSLSGNAGLQLVGVATAVMAARIFDPSARGEIAAAATWLLIMSAVADLGLSQSVPYYVARKVSGAGSTSIVLVVAVSVFLAPFFMFLPGIMGYHLSTAALAYSVVGVPFCTVIGYVGGVSQGRSLHGTLTLVRLFGSMPYAIALVVAAVGRHSPDAVLWQALGLTILVCLLLCFWAGRSSLLSEGPSWQLAGLLTSYGLRTYPGNLARNCLAGVLHRCAVVCGRSVRRILGLRTAGARPNRFV
jgi:O-antigen/teichoic acid export membrane protein